MRANYEATRIGQLKFLMDSNAQWAKKYARRGDADRAADRAREAAHYGGRILALKGESLE